MRHIFIVNPRSGHQDATPVIQKALSELNPSEPYEIYVTSAPGDATHLDGQYAAFGKVLSGMEVVDAICQNTPVTDSNGTVAKENQPVITSIRMIDKPQ